ncbi:MAG: polyamine aminopropyltransferase [Acidobacteriota bacterium]|nr:polyamine aminopropyltransferase [Acidobacteriota bacterium]
MTQDMNLWISEHHEDYLIQQYRVEKTIFSGRSDFQKVDVVETRGHGKVLFIDGLTMISERDEFVYHDMIAHVPLFVHPDPKRVLVIGGGDGGTAREVLRHTTVERAVMVEIDGVVVNACKKYIPQTSCALEDPRLDLRIDDGVRFMAETDELFDVVIVDSTDPIGPAAPLFGEEFYRNVHRVLDEDGIAVAQGESSFYMVDEQKSILKSARAVFPKLHLYNYSNLTYPGGLWSFMFASKGLCPIKDFDPARVKASGLKFRYYNPALHQASFCLAQFQLDLLQDLLTELDVFAS